MLSNQKILYVAGQEFHTLSELTTYMKQLLGDNNEHLDQFKEFCHRLMDQYAYLEVIERMRPVDDLALYNGDFEFGTDNPTYIEVEFVASPERVLRDGDSATMLQEFISAVAVRVARDLFALLPIAKVLVHVEINANTVLSVIFVRNQLCAVNFRNESVTAIVKHFPHNVMENNNYLDSVDRMQL